LILLLLCIALSLVATITLMNYTACSRSSAAATLRGKRLKSLRFDLNSVSKLQNLILVAGHSITVDDSGLDGVERDDDRWMLLDYQRNADMPAAFVKHIREGVALAAADPSSMLMFSGGKTRIDAGPKSEAQSYFQVADHFGWWGVESVRTRTALEEYARDSLQNLMFALCRFRELTGSYPAHVTVISFSFKQERFSEVHRSALHFPATAFSFVGVDPTSDQFRNKVRQYSAWESKASLKPFRSDPYGCHSKILERKRVERNPFVHTPPYRFTCPEMRQLLEHCKPSLFPRGRLPWDISRM